MIIYSTKYIMFKLARSYRPLFIIQTKHDKVQEDYVFEEEYESDNKNGQPESPQRCTVSNWNIDEDYDYDRITDGEGMVQS